MKNGNRILIIENAVDDEEMNKRELQKAGLLFESESVTTYDQFLHAFHHFNPDLVLMDYDVIRKDVFSAIHVVHEKAPEVPVIILMDTLDENIAAETINAGAIDYILKDRLVRLVPAVKHAMSWKKTARRMMHEKTLHSNKGGHHGSKMEETRFELENTKKLLTHEVRERVKNEKELYHSEKKYKELVESANSIIIRWDTSGKITYVNNFTIHFFGYSEDELVGAHIQKLFPKTSDAERNLVTMIHEMVKKPELYVNMEHQNIASDGRLVWVAYTNKAIFDSHGNVSEILSIGNDVTLRRKTEDELRYRIRFEKLLMGLSTSFINRPSSHIGKGIVNALRLLGTFSDVDYCTLYLFEDNHEIKTAYAWSRVDRPLNIHDGLSHADIRILKEKLNQNGTVQNEIPIANDIIGKFAQMNGIQSYVMVPLMLSGSCVGFLLFASKENGLTWTKENLKLLRIAGAIFVNALERKNTEEMLLHERDLTRSYFNTAGVMLVVLDTNGNVRLINKKGKQLLGYDEDFIVGKNWVDLCVPEAYRERVRAVYRKLLNREILDAEYYENPVVIRSGQKRTIAWHNAVLRDSVTGINGILCSGEDITQLKHAQAALREHAERLAQTNEELRAKNRSFDDANERLKELNQTKNEFVSVASHELRTPLTGIIGLTQTLLSEDIELTEDEREKFLRIIELEGKRLGNLLGDLLDLTKIESNVFEIRITQFDLGELINETAGVIRSLHDCTIEVIIQRKLQPLIHADRDRIKQVLMNLMDNAARYSGADGKVIVSLVKKNGTMYVSVNDTGPGLPKEEIPKIFDKFYRTKVQPKTKGKGSGLGLAIAKGIIDAHGGTIWAESDPGSGATLKFTLPER